MRHIAPQNEATANVVKEKLEFVFAEVLEALVTVRADIIGDDLAKAAVRAMEGASARIKLDERLREQYGLDDLEVTHKFPRGDIFLLIKQSQT